MVMPIEDMAEAARMVAMNDRGERHRSNAARGNFIPRVQGSGPDGTNLTQGASLGSAPNAAPRTPARSGSWSTSTSNFPNVFIGTSLQPLARGGRAAGTRRQVQSTPTRRQVQSTPTTPLNGPQATRRSVSTTTPTRPRGLDTYYQATQTVSDTPTPSPSVRGRDTYYSQSAIPRTPSPTPRGRDTSYALSASPTMSYRDYYGASVHHGTPTPRGANRQRSFTSARAENATGRLHSVLDHRDGLSQSSNTASTQQRSSQSIGGQSSQRPLQNSVQQSTTPQVQASTAPQAQSSPSGLRPLIPGLLRQLNYREAPKPKLHLDTKNLDPPS